MLFAVDLTTSILFTITLPLQKAISIHQECKQPDFLCPRCCPCLHSSAQNTICACFIYQTINVAILYVIRFTNKLGGAILLRGHIQSFSFKMKTQLRAAARMPVDTGCAQMCGGGKAEGWIMIRGELALACSHSPGH